jgi:transcriptional regulator with XRE-family HTH domain
LPRRPRTAPAKPPSPKRVDAFDAAIGRNICIQRIEAGMSQTALADALGVSFQQVQKYEKGVNRVGGGRLMRIARVLGVPVVALYEGIDDRAQLGMPSALALLAGRAPLRLVRAFARLRDRAVRRATVALVENLAAGSL